MEECLAPVRRLTPQSPHPQNAVILCRPENPTSLPNSCSTNRNRDVRPAPLQLARSTSSPFPLHSSLVVRCLLATPIYRPRADPPSGALPPLRPSGALPFPVSLSEIRLVLQGLACPGNTRDMRVGVRWAVLSRMGLGEASHKKHFLRRVVLLIFRAACVWCLFDRDARPSSARAGEENGHCRGWRAGINCHLPGSCSLGHSQGTGTSPPSPSLTFCDEGIR